ATERAATPDEVARMRSLVAEAMAAGAIGFATSKSPTHVGFGGRPVPSRAADVAEIGELARGLARSERGVVQATTGPGFFLDELAEVARASGRPVTWTALLSGVYGENGHRPILAKTRGRSLVWVFVCGAPALLECFPSSADGGRTDGVGKEAFPPGPACPSRSRTA